MKKIMKKSHKEFLQTHAKTVYLPVDKIVPMEEVKRAYYDPKERRRLYSQIKSLGHSARFPLGVFSDRKRKLWVCFDGLHRLEIDRKLGIERVPCVVEKISRLEAIRRGTLSNVTQSKLNLLTLPEC